MDNTPEKKYDECVFVTTENLTMIDPDTVKTVSPFWNLYWRGISLRTAPLVETPSHVSGPTAPSLPSLALMLISGFMKEMA